MRAVMTKSYATRAEKSSVWNHRPRLLQPGSLRSRLFLER